jgi:alpha-1,3-rhamnosyl/mannosyltransferase
MRVAFDGLILLSPRAGIARYASELVTELGKIPSLELRFFFLSSWGDRPPANPAIGIRPLKQIIKALVPRPYNLLEGYRQLAFNWGVRHKKFDIYHTPSFIPLRFNGPTVVTVHDLSHLHFPQMHPALRVRQLDKRLPQAITNSAVVLTGSQAIREEIINTFSVRPEKVMHTYYGVSPRFAPRTATEASPTLKEYKLQYKQYILCVGTLEPRKNLATVLQAYSRLDAGFKDKYPLVIVGTPGWGMDAPTGSVAKMVRAGSVRLLGYVPDGELPFLYAGASTLVFTSLYEGFGFPILEAMASGTRVITSNRGAMKEIAGGFADLVDPHNVEQLSDALLAAVIGTRDADYRLGAARRWASQFSWDRCAAETATAYRFATGRLQ